MSATTGSPSDYEKASLANDEGHDTDITSNGGHDLNEKDEQRRLSLTPNRPLSTASKQDQGVNDAPQVDEEKAEAAVSQDKTLDPNVVWWDGMDDPENPLNWSSWLKYSNVGIISGICFVTPLASSMFAPGVKALMKEFDSTNETLGSFVVSVYVLGFAAGPMILAPCSELYGRAIVYHVCNMGFVAFTIGCAVATSLDMLIVFRFFAGCFGSGVLTIGGGSIADLIHQEKRAAAMSAFVMGPLLGPVIGPVAGGYLTDAKGWRWVFWILAMVSGFFTILSFVMLRETYAVTILGRKTKRLQKETGNMELKSKLDSGLSVKDLFWRSIVRPTKMLFRQPIIASTAIYMGIIYGYLYLLFTTFCRSGDITRSRGYTEEFMRWDDIKMKLAHGDDSLDGIQLTCIIKFEKGHKADTNEDRDVPLPTLKDPALNIVCPVKLLLIQALRSGNISSLDDALLQASSRGDRTIQWLYPQRPVFPQQQRNSGILSWDLPAPAEPVNKAVHQLGLVAGLLANIISHDVRRGSLRDVANLKPSHVTQSGVATKLVAQTAGHSAASYARGTTSRYVGELEHETWSARVEQKFESRKAPVIGSAFKKRRLTSAELNSYCEEKGIDPRSSNGRRDAGAELHRKREQDWIKDQRANRSTPSKTPGGPSGGAPTTVVAPFSASKPQEWTPSIGSTTPSSNSSATKTPASASTTTTTSPPATSASATPEPSVPIDPRLLLLDGGDVPVDDNLAERFSALACNTTDAPTEGEQEMALQILVDNVQATSESILTLPGSRFVDALSKINVIRCARLQNKGLKNIHDNFPTFCAMGNSRDYPTLYTYTCQVCKEYTTQLDSVLQSHLRSCKGAKEKKEKNFKCDHEGCGKSFGTLKSLQSHMDGVHLFESQKCPEAGCKRDEVFATKDGLTSHLAQFHRPIDPPVCCSFAECQSQNLFAQIHNLQEHLRKVHKLSSMKQINPYLPTDTSRPSLVIPYHPRSCPLGGSSACSGIFKSLTGLVRHLVSEKGVHGLKYGEAKVTATRTGNDGGEGGAFLSEERVGDEEDDDIDG